MSSVRAQAPVEPARAFDFWLGEWDAVWSDGAQGSNSVTAELDGRVVVERFDGRPGAELQGMSVSVFDLEADTWRQTWVDNLGNYLDFEGRFSDGAMDLRRTAPDGTLWRMRWYDIAHEAFSWSWERSDDAGTNWEPRWQIEYTRRGRLA
ncbi:MAG: hypothetical protein QOE36_142 [Gaiellaceae bacterium]|nr:hypothetical protein [Gaiellaceae bacterium]